MAIIAGIDEAGYGPLMGPLVVSATAFQVSEADAATDLWTLFEPAISHARPRHANKVCVDDSKRVYDRKQGIGSLEKHVLPFLSLLGAPVRSLRELLSAFCAHGKDNLTLYPWYRDDDPALPRATALERVCTLSGRLADCLAERGSRFCFARVELMDVAAFNREVIAARNKSVALGGRVAELVAALWEFCEEAPLFLTVDKQGGRNYYAGFLAGAFPFARIDTRVESPARSEYIVRKGPRQMQIAFQMKGDRHSLPVALASMLSKYLREVFVEMLNDYWSARVPGLQPTAGYFTDGRRFLAEIDTARATEGVPMELLARCR